MANVTYIGNARSQKQLVTITPSSVSIGQTFKITIGDKTVTFTATAGTVANVTAGLLALVTASDIPNEFSADIAWADATTALTATAKTAGKPFTLSVAGGTGTIAAVTTTANSGPSDASVVGNYSTGALPSSTDTLIIDGLVSNADILWGLDQHTIALAALIIRNYRGSIGLPESNTGGYKEYRQKTFLWGYSAAAPITITNCANMQRCKLGVYNNGTVAMYVDGCGASGSESGFPAVLIDGCSTNSSLRVNKGSVGWGTLSTYVATITSLNVGYDTSASSDVSVAVGPGGSLTNIDASGGKVTCSNQTLATVSISGPCLLSGFAGTSNSITNVGGTVDFTGNGTIANYIGQQGSTLDCTGDQTGRTVTACTLSRSSSNGAAPIVKDPNGVVTWTNPISVGTGLRITDLSSSDFGTGLTLQP